MITGGQDAHPTRWDNLFLGNPLAEAIAPAYIKIFTLSYLRINA
ncbi:MAG: hypothetical protein V7K98_15980 [Nostoc sp.]